MANRTFNQFRQSLEPQAVELFAIVTIGSAGAPTLTRGKGIASVALTATGKYTLTLSDVYNRLLGVDETIKSGTSPAAAPIIALVSETVASTKTVVIQHYAIDNSTATNPASGEVLYIRITLGNTTV